MSFIVTQSKKRFDFLNLRPEDIEIEDIAHALSMLCRFTGHTIEFYSVAQHSVLVSQLVPPEYALWGLLHDATEAYLNDISSPLKKIINGRYCELENSIMKTVCGKFGLSEEEPQIVKNVDRALTWTELLLLVDPDFPWWEEYEGKILDINIEPWFNAKFRFLYRFNELCR